MNLKKGFALFLCIALVFGNVLTTYGVTTKNGSEISETVATDSIKLQAAEGMEQVAESDSMILYLDQSKAMLRLMSKKTGQYIDTKTFEGTGGNGAIQNIQKSDMNFTYMVQTKGKSDISYDSIDDYSLSLQLDGVTYKSIDKGVRIDYEIGDNSITYNDFPKFITEDRMKQFVIKNLNSIQKQQLTTTYYRLSQGTYVRKSDEEHILGKLAAQELYNYFYEIGTYTTDELTADNEANGVEITNANQHITASIEYTLDGDDLLVRVPVNEIVTQEQFPLQSIDILPYFLTGTQEDDGYLFVPDGSGAIINFNNQKYTEYAYSSRYYGGDKLIASETYKEELENLNLPIFGMKKNQYAVLGIIEKGASIATVNATVNGMVDEYNKVSLSFAIRDIDNITASNLSNFTIPKYSTDYYNDDIVIRYKFLTEDDADYSGMAKAYQQYLLDQGTLVKRETEEQAPFYVDLLGAIDKKEFFLGIPYKTMVSLTSFDQAQEILTSLNKQNINNLKVSYTGIANGGMNQTAVKSIKVLSVLGGKNGLKDLNAFTESIGADLFPDFQLQTTNSGKGLSKKMQPINLNGAIAQIYDFDLVTRLPLKSSKNTTRMIAASALPNYIKKFNSSYSKLGITNLASSDLGSFVAANYKKKHNVSMANSEQYYQDVVAQLGSDYKLMLSNPMVYTYKSASYIKDLPVSSNKNKLIDYDIPFVQMVLSGYVNYSMPIVNTESLELSEELMKAIETKSSLNFRFTYESAEVLKNTEYNDIFLAQYSLWQDKVGGLYTEYNDFYQKVKDASIVKHQTVDGNEELRVVEYSNGIRVYFNYGKTSSTINGVKVDPSSYIIR